MGDDDEKMVSLALALSLLVLCSCSTKPETTTPVSITQPVSESTTAAAAEEPDASWSILAANGQVTEEDGVAYAAVCIPANLVGEGVTQESLDAGAGEFYTSASLSEAGDVCYKMTQDQHKAMIKSLEEAFGASLSDLATDPEHQIAKVQYSDDFTVFDVYLKTEELTPADGYTALAFCLCGNYYGLFKGGLPEKIVIRFYNVNGELLNTLDTSEGQ